MAKKKPIKNNAILNLHHPKLHGKVEYAFTALGTKYYNFKADTEARYGRYVVLQAYLQEYNLRSSLDLLVESYEKIEKWLNPEVTAEKTGTLQIGKTLELVAMMKQRAKIGFEPDTVYRLASCLFFDETEILSEFDLKYNEAKIARWKEANVTDFFFNKLFQESTRLKVTSKTDLENYLRKYPELVKEWNTLTGILSR